MSTPLEDAIREAASSGRLDGLTLWQSDGRWQGNARWKGSQGWTVEHHVDPAEALMAALRSTTRFDHSDRPAVPAPKVDGAFVAGVFD